MTILAYFGFNPMQTQFIAFGSEGSEQGFLPLTKTLYCFWYDSLDQGFPPLQNYVS